MFADYINVETEEIITYRKKYGIDFPEEIEQDGKIYKRYYGRPPVIDVAEGLHGNAKDGYTGGNSTYIKSNFTPNNVAFGKYGRIGGVETDHRM